jgi:hypothetical protein
MEGFKLIFRLPSLGENGVGPAYYQNINGVSTAYHQNINDAATAYRCVLSERKWCWYRVPLRTVNINGVGTAYRCVLSEHKWCWYCLPLRTVRTQIVLVPRTAVYRQPINSTGCR